MPVGSATAVRATRYNSEDGTTIEDDEDTGDMLRPCPMPEVTTTAEP